MLRALSPLVPLMYIDSVCDGMLKGLDKQSFVFRLSVFDSASRILLVAVFVPRMGMTGFLLVMFISNALTGVWRVVKLLKTAKTTFSFERWLIKPFLFAAIAAAPAALLENMAIGSAPVRVMLSFAVSIALYIVLVLRGGLISRDDIEGIFKK